MSRTRPAPDEVWTGSRLRGAPRPLFFVLLGVEIAAVGIATAALAIAQPTPTTFLRLGVLAALCVAFEEIALQVGKLRLLISSGPQADMTSVWTFGGALVLPAGYAAVLATVMAIDVWLRRQRASGQLVYRKVYSAATIVLACLATTAVRAQIAAHLGGPSWLVSATAIVLAGVAYTLVNRILIVVAARLASPQAEVSLIGNASDNALELSTLCLAVMTSFVVLHQPALAILALLPMVLLQRGALIKQLETAAAIDSKTGLLNALAWHEAARRETARLIRQQSNGGVLLIDLDHFKAVNDTHGHLAGDAALRAVGARLTLELRQYDIVGRFGGEEFVVLLPGVGPDDAYSAAERVRRAINSIEVSELAPGGEGTLAASIGLALIPEHGTELEELLAAADAAVYRAKREGRNRVVVAGDAPRDHVAMTA